MEYQAGSATSTEKDQLNLL